MRDRQTWSAYMRYRSDCSEELLGLLWDQPDKLIEMGEPLIRKRCVRATIRVRIEGQQYVVKRWLERSAYHVAKQLVLPSRAARCWKHTQFLLARGVCTPRPLAYRENRWGPLRGISCLVYPYVSGRNLYDVSLRGPLPEALALHVGRQLARTLCQFARARTSHNDPSVLNFILDYSARLWVIDLDKLHYHRSHRTAIRRYHSGLDGFFQGDLFTPDVIAAIRRVPEQDASAGYGGQVFPRKPSWQVGREGRRRPVQFTSARVSRG